MNPRVRAVGIEPSLDGSEIQVHSILASPRWGRRRTISDPVEALRRALASRYRIGPRLGAGGMADVFSADDLRHGRTVAIKVLKPEVAAAIGRERFLAEIRVTAQLRHPNILPLYDSGEADGVLYYVMPKIDGETLAHRLDREPQLPLEDAVRIVREVSSGLEYAHARGVVHRDIKPSNILSDDGRAVLADFGIARAPAEDASGRRGLRLTRTGSAIGSPQYMSPEQASGSQDLDARSDLYALACVMYEMLAGHPPFSGPTPLVVMSRHALDPVPSLKTARPQLPNRVVEAVERALAKSPADRFATAGAFAAALTTAERPSIVIAPDRRPSTPPAGVDVHRPTIAVLPFRDLCCGEAVQAFFIAGIHEAIIAELGKIAALRTISRTTMTRYADSEEDLSSIARELAADAVMEGSVLRADTRVRITLRLIHGADETSLWTETYERDATDMLALHAEVARAVAEAVEARLTTAERTRLSDVPSIDPRAYELYLRGRHQSALIPDEARRGVKYFEQTIALAPDFARAHSGLARRLVWLVSLGLESGDAEIPRAVEAAGRAYELDPESADALAVLGYLKFVADWDAAGADELLRRAVEVEPGNQDAHMDYAFLLCATGRFEEAERIITHMELLDPFSPPTALHRGWFLYMARRFDEAARHLTEQAQRYPWFAYLQVFAGLSEAYLGHVEVAREHARAAEAAGTHGRSLDFLAGLIQLYALTGRPEDARRILGTLESQLTGDEGAWFRWMGRAVLDDGPDTIHLFDRALEQRNPMLVLLPHHPSVECARRHPYMRDRILAMGLVDRLPDPLDLPAPFDLPGA